jgi:Protein of unknown function (DUF2911)
MHRPRSFPFTLAAAAAFAALLLPLSAAAQDLHPSRRPSPMGMARITLDGAYVRVVYSRPYKRGRDNIFGTKESGALVPFGEVWRTGANEATEITATKDLMVAGKRLPAGTYSLFTTAGPEEWTFHFNSDLGMWGTMKRNADTGKLEEGYDAAHDVIDVTAKPTKLGEEVDQLTVSFESSEGGGADLVLRWISTEVRVPIKVAM